MTNKTLFWSFYVSFCAFCVPLRLTRTVFSWLLKKAISMALWTKAILCGKSSLLEQSMPRTPSRQIQNQCNLRNLRLKNSCLYSLYLCAFLWLKNMFNQRNPRLINDLRSTKDYVRNYKLFLQNEPKFRKSQMNVSDLLTREYDKMDTWSSGKNEPKTNPNEPKTKPNSKRPK